MQSSVTWTVIQGPIGRFPFNPRQVLCHPDHDLLEREAPRYRQRLPPHFHPYFRNPVVVRIFSASLGTEKWVWKVHTCATWPPSKASSGWWIWTSTSPCLSGTPWTSGPPPPTFTRHTCRARATGFPTSSFSTLTLAALKAKWDVKSNFVFVSRVIKINIGTIIWAKITPSSVSELRPRLKRQLRLLFQLRRNLKGRWPYRRIRLHEMCNQPIRLQPFLRQPMTILGKDLCEKNENILMVKHVTEKNYH